jgi:hypothetical protein
MNIWEILGCAGILIFVASLVWLIINAVRYDSVKPPIFMLATSVILVVGSYVVANGFDGDIFEYPTGSYSQEELVAIETLKYYMLFCENPKSIRLHNSYAITATIDGDIDIYLKMDIAETDNFGDRVESTYYSSDLSIETIQRTFETDGNNSGMDLARHMLWGDKVFIDMVSDKAIYELIEEYLLFRDGYELQELDSKKILKAALNR